MKGLLLLFLLRKISIRHAQLFYLGMFSHTVMQHHHNTAISQGEGMGKESKKNETKNKIIQSYFQ